MILSNLHIGNLILYPLYEGSRAIDHRPREQGHRPFVTTVSSPPPLFPSETPPPRLLPLSQAAAAAVVPTASLHRQLHLGPAVGTKPVPQALSSPLLSHPCTSARDVDAACHYTLKSNGRATDDNASDVYHTVTGS
ncbi:hypothetical protein BHE74_00012709 [Ensete ventricosum]|nr:hypothetical protein BHE74_00012709 [Ensete ventricosum]